MFRIRFEVAPQNFHCPIKPKIWATMSLWNGEGGVEFETETSNVCDVESLSRGGGYPKMTQKLCVEIILKNPIDGGAQEAQESAEKLAEMLGLEFGLDKAPVVGFEADKS